MAPRTSRLVRVRKPDLSRRIFKLLAVCKDPNIYNVLLKRAPEKVIKLICNAAVNASRGEVHLTPAQKKLFAKHRHLFQQLTTRQVSIESKRKLLNQRGNGLPLIPILLSAVLSSLGSLIFSK